MNKNSKSYKLAISGLLIGIAVVLGTFSIPIFGARVSPMQHFVNVISAIILGPTYAVGNAFISSLIRNILGTGSLLAFPGSMVGAFLAGILYKKFKNNFSAVIGEFIGTGIIGAIIAYPIASIFMGKAGALFVYVIPFSSSCLVGGLMAYVLLSVPVTKEILKIKTVK